MQSRSCDFFCHFFSMKYPAPSGTCLEVLLSKHRLVKLLKSEPVTLSVQGHGNHLFFSGWRVHGTTSAVLPGEHGNDS